MLSWISVFVFSFWGIFMKLYEILFVDRDKVRVIGNDCGVNYRSFNVIVEMFYEIDVAKIGMVDLTGKV